MPRRGGRVVAGAVFPGILPRPAEGFALILRPQGRPGGPGCQKLTTPPGKE